MNIVFSTSTIFPTNSKIVMYLKCTFKLHGNTLLLLKKEIKNGKAISKATFLDKLIFICI